MPKIVLFQPEIAGNVGNIIRTCACFDYELHIIEPCGFPFDLKKIKSSAMDYLSQVKITRHGSFSEFMTLKSMDVGSRIVLATTKGETDYRKFNFSNSDYLLFGRESSGVCQEVFEKADEKITIKMKNGNRSLNLAVACGIIASMAADS